MSSGECNGLVRTRVTWKGQVTLRVAIRRASGIRKGNLVAATRDGDAIALVPMRPLDES